MEIHAFSDASCKAYSACIYLRSIDKNNKIQTKLLLAKSKVAPLKQLSTPRLELCGALLASRLANKVKNSLRLNVQDSIYWCDSIIVLGWIKTSKSNLKLFLLNRINEITEHTDQSSWRYIPTKLNPADIGSRGLNAAQLNNADLWWSGPSFLSHDESSWPQQPQVIQPADLPETKIRCHLSLNNNFTINLINRYSSFTKLLHVTAYVFRFIYNIRNKSNKLNLCLKVSELTMANNYL
ncbi:unnamed protein product [Parnassius mnemosyne]|uniref:Uncharacterized protein n=1 Tax=Parnassius mnemosyne TaxID=213953 RepID=A0AAV1L773_9NEOP